VQVIYDHINESRAQTNTNNLNKDEPQMNNKTL